MGSLLSSITGKGSQGTAQGLSGLTGAGQSALAGGDVNLSNQVAGLVPGMQNIANTQQQYGGNLLSSGQGQYNAGLSGALTPAQQALTDYTLGQNRGAMNQIYSGLGLGGSTMNTQDLNAANLQSLAQQEQIDFANQQMGMAAMQQGSGMEQAGAQDIMNQGALYGEAGGLKGDAGKLLGMSQSNLNNFLKSILSSTGAGGQGVGNAAGLSSMLGLPQSAGGSSLLDTILGNYATGQSASAGIDTSSGLAGALSPGGASGPFDLFSAMFGGSGGGAGAASAAVPLIQDATSTLI